ncbi:MAG: hypothetical protein PHE56_04015 [Bacteroidales bacterium]|nr:hypothetical protein [Bacteroidales bacterium]
MVQKLYFCAIMVKKQLNRHNQDYSDFSDANIINVIEIIVKKFIKTGQIQFCDYDDVKQSLAEKFFRKKESIINGFNHEAGVRTYISAVVYKMTLEIIREQNKTKNYDEYGESYQSKNLNPEEKLILDDEKEYLKRVFESFDNDKSKMLIFLKIYFRIPITRKDFFQYCGFEDNRILSEINCIDVNCTDKDIYQTLCRLNVLAGNKEVMPDAMRMYINQITDKVIKRLNGKHGRAGYSRESLGILMELVFEENKN